MNARSLWVRYRCHQRRGKSWLQLLAELGAKASPYSDLSGRLTQFALRRHGIRPDLRVDDMLTSPPGQTEIERDTLCSGAFFVDFSDESLWASWRSQFESQLSQIVEDADAICQHRFTLLSDQVMDWGTPIDWHVDPQSGYRWPRMFAFTLQRSSQMYAPGAEVKVPWELSRMQQLPTLGLAYRLTQNEMYATEIIDQITHWLDENPCPYGVNWVCAMDVAIRIMNIIWAYLLIASAAVLTTSFRTRLAMAIWQHAQFIRYHLEYDFLADGTLANGNHFLTNIVGLLHLGLICPEFTQAAAWRQIGVDALIEEMDRQVHPDGVNFESSVSYHRLTLELFCAGALLCRANGVSLPERFWERLEKMFEVVLWVTRPDGQAPQVGDADDGRLYILGHYGAWDRADYRYLLSLGAVLFQRSDLKAYANGLSQEALWLLGPTSRDRFESLPEKIELLPSKAFEDAGLYVMRSDRMYLLASCGEVGTAGIGNHKHNDLLSFEFYADDRALIVDPGAFGYTRNPIWRNRFRSTAYHNTVVVDGQEQNRFAENRLFDMTADATVTVHKWSSQLDADFLDVEHTGYDRLASPVRHRRRFRLNKHEGVCQIADRLSGRGKHTVDWYFHFDHGLTPQLLTTDLVCTWGDGSTLALDWHTELPLEVSLIDGWVSRRYGVKLKAAILRLSGVFRCEAQVQFAFTLG